MRIQPDCIPCIFKMAVSSMRELQLEEDRMKSVLGKVATLPGLRGDRWDLISTEVIERVMDILVEEARDPDPFRLLKRRQNEAILEIESVLEDLILSSADPLRTAVKLAVLGNALDLMVGDNPADIEHFLRKKLRDDVPDREYSLFRDRLEESRMIVLILDNAGEIVFDRFLVQLIRRVYGLKTTVVVRSVPALNDATRAEAEEAGMDRIATVIENGIMAPYPGTDLARCSEEVQDLVKRADLILSKGGGNYDSLTEAPQWVQQKTFFMLLSKCPPYCKRFGAELFKPVLAHIC